MRRAQPLDVDPQRLAAIRPGVYAVAWRPACGRRPGRWVQRRVIELVVLLGHERAVFEELDPLRSGRPPRSSCRREALARWAEHVLPNALPNPRRFGAERLALAS